MLKLYFEGNTEDLIDGIEIFARQLGYEISADGIKVQVEKSIGNIEVTSNQAGIKIKYNEKIHFFRALGLLVEALQEKREYNIIEEPQFSMNGPMIDVSRNAVLTVESIKKFLRTSALMGLNMMMLYTEDTYTVEDEPYFGYMRGRYTYDELKECDDYANILGIEMIPCIQALAHLEQFLKWDAVADLRDTERELLVNSEKTYDFLRKAIKAAAAPFRSKRIHIGMDEAHGLGLGRYLDLNGYNNRFEIMTMHLNRVFNITDQLGLKPMMWSDMYYRLGSKTGNYYDPDAVIPEDIVEKIPKGIQQVYWDYYHNNSEFYQNFIEKHKKFGSDPVFAGGLWTWTGICANYKNAINNTHAALDACKKQGIKEVIATMWGDNGGECNMFSALLGLQLYAEHGYSKELDIDKLKRRVKFCTGIEFDAFHDLIRMNEAPGENAGQYESNPSKLLLWQDILIGLFDKDVEAVDMNSHYFDLEKVFNNHRQQNKDSDFIFGVTEKLCAVLKLKSNLGLQLKKAYDDKNIEELETIAYLILPNLKKNVKILRSEHREQWFSTYKPFGWEIIDIRYGGLIARIDTAIKRLTDYLDGKINKIEELEEERLHFDGTDKNLLTGSKMNCNYHRIASANAYV